MKNVQKVAILLSIFFLFSCEKEIDKYYERPGWLPGSAWEVLAGKGNYSLFLEGCKLTELDVLIKGKGLCTVFAPTDEAIIAYLKTTPYSSLTDMADVAPEELKVLMGFHIVEYSFNRDQLVAFNPAGVNMEEEATGQYYKQQTFAREGVELVSDPNTGQQYKVMRQEKYLPFISSEYFKSFELSTPAYNYNYFFPNTTYVAGENNVQVANASVTEYEIAADNGYIHLISEVLKPLRTVYSVLEDENLEFSMFKSLYDRFTKMTYNEDLSNQYSDSLFTYLHSNNLPNIASEWTFNGEYGFSVMIAQSTGVTYNSFIPTDAALHSFFSQWFGDQYAVENMDLLVLDYFINNHVLDRRIVFPEEVKNGKCQSPFGDKIDFDVDNAVHKELCGNGVFYGINEVVIPAMFKSVTKPIFTNDNYSIFRYFLHKSGQMIQLINPELEYSMFIPTNDAFAALGIRLNEGEANVLGDEKLERADEDGEYKEILAAEVVEIATYQFVREGISQFDNKKIYKTANGSSYIKTFDGGVLGEVSSSTPQEIKLIGNKETGLTNGYAYEVDQLFARPTETLFDILSGYADYSTFFKKLKDAGLVVSINGIEEIPFMVGETMMCFAPTNDLMATLTLPEDPKELVEYLKYFFISLDANGLVEYVLPNIGDVGTYETLGVDYSISTETDLIYKEMSFRFGQEFNLFITNPTTKKEVSTISNEYPVFTKNGVLYCLKSADLQ